MRRRWQHFQLAETAGSLDSRFYAIGSASFQSEHLQAGLNHSNYIWKGQHAQVNSQSLAANVGSVSGFYSVFQSAAVSGSAVSASWRVGAFDVHGTEILSKQKQFLGSVSEFSASTSGLRSISAAATDGTRRISAADTRATSSSGRRLAGIVLSLLTKAPFQKTLTVNVGFQLPFHGTRVHVGTFASPSGGSKFTAYAGTYASLPWEPTTDQRGQGVRISGFELRGTLTTADGGPVEGAAIKIGRNTVYTNADGTFLAREAQCQRTCKRNAGRFYLRGNVESRLSAQQRVARCTYCDYAFAREVTSACA